MRDLEQELFLRAIPEPNSGCWLWLGYVSPTGYGRYCFQGKNHAAHRYFWQLKHGDIENGLSVLHKCDNRLCVNPSHLYLGTQQQNIVDMVDRNRQAKGSKVHQSKLAPDDVVQIFESSEPRHILAKKYGVMPSTIKRIREKKGWDWLTRDMPRSRGRGRWVSTDQGYVSTDNPLLSGSLFRVLEKVPPAPLFISGSEMSKEFGCKSSTLYSMLKRLVRFGWIETKLESSSSGKPLRRLYSMTAAGLQKMPHVLIADTNLEAGDGG